ncbi:hypothetical protein CB172_22010 [Salmonella enterica subsp. enterica serovar Claibornei]|nr:hypothetical protein [Salmonella enterica subsp. enterica serovar Claibornei]
MASHSSVSGVPPATSSALLPPSSPEALTPNDDNNPPATSAEINSLLRPLFFPRLFAVSLATAKVPVAGFQMTLNILFIIDALYSLI